MSKYRFTLTDMSGNITFKSIAGALEAFLFMDVLENRVKHGTLREWQVKEI